MRSEFWGEQFQMTAAPAVWALQGRRLKHAADLVFEAYVRDLGEMQSGCSPLDLNNLESAGPATLLYGLAFENIIKALIVKREGPMIEQGKLVKQWPRHHKLVNLASRAEIVLTDAQRDLLARLTAFVEWSGRYPIPLSRDEMPLKQEGVSSAWFPLPVQPHEWGAVGDFYQTLDARVLDA